MKFKRLKQIIDALDVRGVAEDCEVYIQIEDEDGDPNFIVNLDDVMNTCTSLEETDLVALTLIGIQEEK